MKIQVSYHEEKRDADVIETIDALYDLLHSAYHEGETHVHLSFGDLNQTGMWESTAEVIVPLNETIRCRDF